MADMKETTMNLEASKTAPILTAQHLRRLGASPYYVRRFSEEWPEGAPVTVETMLRARELCLDIDLLLRQAPAEYLAEYMQVRAMARAEFKQTDDAALAKYDRIKEAMRAELATRHRTSKIRGPLSAEYRRLDDAALDEYEHIRAAALAKYERDIAQTTVACIVSLLRAEDDPLEVCETPGCQERAEHSCESCEARRCAAHAVGDPISGAFFCDVDLEHARRHLEARCIPRRPRRLLWDDEERDARGRPRHAEPGL